MTDEELRRLADKVNGLAATIKKQRALLKRAWLGIAAAHVTIHEGTDVAETLAMLDKLLEEFEDVDL